MTDIDRGNALLGELFLDQLPAQIRISAQVAAALKTAHQQFCREGTGGWVVHTTSLKLQLSGPSQLIHRKAADQALAEHAFSGLAHHGVPGEVLDLRAFLKPTLLFRAEVDRADPGG